MKFKICLLCILVSSNLFAEVCTVKSLDINSDSTEINFDYIKSALNDKGYVFNEDQILIQDSSKTTVDSKVGDYTIVFKEIYGFAKWGVENVPTWTGAMVKIDEANPQKRKWVSHEPIKLDYYIKGRPLDGSRMPIAKFIDVAIKRLPNCVSVRLQFARNLETDEEMWQKWGAKKL